MDSEPKTLIGVLASHDSVTKNQALKRVFDSAVETEEGRKVLAEFRFLFTGGTYMRLFEGWPVGQPKGEQVDLKLKPDTIFTKAADASEHKTLSSWIRHTLKEATTN